jgi:DNA polymerase-3 subunit beta
MFNLSIAKNQLLPRLLMVAGAVDKRQSLAILSNILLHVDKNRLTLTATDLDIEISATFDFDTDNLDNKITIPAKKFIDIIRSLDDNTIATINVTDGIAKIKAGMSQFKLATLPAEQFPCRHHENPVLNVSLMKNDLLGLLQSTHFAMSQQDVRIFLNGLLLDFNHTTIKAVATDGHRMAICNLTIDNQLEPQQLLIPRKSVQEIIRLLNSITDNTIQVIAGKNYFRIITNDYHFTSKLIDARFPPYARAVPIENDKIILVEKERLKRCLSRITILAHEKSRAVRLHVEDKKITLVAHNQEQEEATESLEAVTEGDGLDIGINASYLLDVLNFMPNGMIRLSMSTSDKSMLVQSPVNPNYQYIIMPMKL